MRKKMIRIEPLELGKFFAILMGSIALIVGVVFGLITLASEGLVPAVMVLFGVTIGYIISGMIAGVIYGWIINFTLKKMGGLTISFENE